MLRIEKVVFLKMHLLYDIIHFYNRSGGVNISGQQVYLHVFMVGYT